MIILVEGADGSGKTTLCEQLCKYTNFERLDVEQDNQQDIQYLLAKFSNTYYVCDRSFISDLVYRLHDGKPRRGMGLREMSYICSETGVIIVHCKSGTEYEDSMSRGEDNITIKTDSDDIVAIYDKIISMFNIFSSVPVIKYNWRIDNINDVINFVKGGKTNAV